MLVFLPIKKIHDFISALQCPKCQIDFIEPTPALFSFNHPYGACPHCQGFGQEPILDWKKVIPDQSLSLADDGVSVWNFGSHTIMYKKALKTSRGKKIFKKPFHKYTEADWEWLREGEGRTFIGVNGYYDWVLSKRHKTHYRIHAARYRKYVTCSVCDGQRLNPNGLACRVDGENFAEVCKKSVMAMYDWLDEVLANHVKKASESADMGVEEALVEAKARVNYLKKIGLRYLTIDRQTRTLSGGEQQRINMARCLGSALTDTLYCLDEPTAGLHARDSHNLLDIVHELRDQGNTVVVVEHEKALINGADHLIEIGPLAGHRGGELTYNGGPKITDHSKFDEFEATTSRKEFIKLKGASTHNLKNVSASFPVGGLTGVCGVSGSGKSSLIQHSLYPMLEEAFGQTPQESFTESKAESVGPEKNIHYHSEVVAVNQTPIGRSSRSNIATYLGVFDEIRKLLAAQPLAKKLGLKPGSFSFNTSGGRCETCRGLGTVIEDLSFLGEMAVICPTCNGRRFDEEVLSVDYKGKQLSEILKLTVNEAREHFYDHKKLVKILDVIIDMGLGYINLGQNTNSFSGGEAQRLKLIKLLNVAKKSAKPKILIFDEPTTGLSDHDVVNLMAQLKKLTEMGHTLIVVEHHLGVLQSCDWLIEIGPDAAADGGELVYEGPPDGLKEVQESITAKYLF